MPNQGSANMGPWANDPGNTQSNIPANIQQTYPQAVNPMMEDAMTYRAVYPEIFYKLQPYILMASDVMGTYGTTMPTQQQVEQMSDGIFEDFCKMYPDMATYMNKNDNANDDPPGDPPGDPPFFRGGPRRGFGGGGYFRRRGVGRDLIDTLLLAELLGRGRYYY
jgi:hypothetical protein